MTIEETDINQIEALAESILRAGGTEYKSMAQLAIKGHPTRSKEIVELIEMLGGKSSINFKCDNPNKFYYVLDGYLCWDYIGPEEINNFTIYTLEDFLEKYPYKIGDFVSIPEYESEVRICEMQWDGFEIQYKVYRVDEEEWYTGDELLDYNDNPNKTIKDMEQKINIAELLKDCPKGMELYSTIYGTVYFEGVRNTGNAVLIDVKTSCNTEVQFYPDGKFNTYYSDSEITLFPSKDIRNWEGFHRPFKDGDVIFTHANCLKVGLCNTWISIYQENRDGRIMTYVNYDVDYAVNGDNYYGDVDGGFLCMENDIIHQRYATEEEKQKLFDAIKVNGYKWNAETKTLEKLVKPKFKVGDRIVKQNSISNLWIVSSINSQYYGLNLLKGGESIGVLSISEQDDWELAPNIEPKFKVGDKVKDKNDRVWFIVHVSEKHFNISRIPNPESADGSGYYVPIEDQDEYELVPDKFDITTLVPFESRVLVRDSIDGVEEFDGECETVWRPAVWGVHVKDNAYPFGVVGGCYFRYCIPYEGNEHLLSTTDDCDEYYKVWK